MEEEAPMELRFQVYAKIARSLTAVFNAVTEPDSLSAYFTTGGASGPLRQGATVIWKFGAMPGEYPVKVTKLIPNERIEFDWEANEKGYDTHVEMSFEAQDAGTTIVRIAEYGWRENPKGLESSYMNCHGWTQMLCCLKGHLEYKINLRQGFY
jgi:uncharacterized protein YndB with AHSA1/START domain